MYNYIKMPLACLLIMAYTFAYYKTKRRLNTRTARAFEGMSVFALIHLLAAVVTEYTVNNRDKVSPAFNYVWHIIFLVSVTCICGWMLYYLLLYVERGSGRLQRTQKILLIAVCAVGIILEILLPIEYIDTEYGSYSLGMKAYVLYAVVVYTLIALIITIFRYRYVIEADKSRVLIVSVVIFIIVAVIQMVYPYILLTYLATTMIMLGIMVNTEDAHLYIRYQTGLYNELGMREMLQELLLLKKPFQVGMYVFLGEDREIESAMISIYHKLPEKERKLICGTFADNVLVVLPLSSLSGKCVFPKTLPEPEYSGDRLNYKKEIFEVTGRETVSDIREFIYNYKNSYEEDSLKRDELTGLLRRAPFIRQVDYLISSRQGFTFMMLDLDDFKSINDLYGHSVGDEALKYVAGVLIGVLRTSDIICRIGGDEFAVALVGATDEKVVREIADRIRKGLREQEVLPDERCSIKMSLGAKIHFAKDGEPSFQELYTEADAALYHAKREGKDRLHLVK